MKETSFSVHTKAREQILLVTDQVQRALSDLNARDGICCVMVPHTTCAISVNENADPDVPADLVKALRAMVPRVDFRHAEGNSDAHLLSAVIGQSLSWPYRAGKLILGTWQGVYFIELDGPRTRKVHVYTVE